MAAVNAYENALLELTQEAAPLDWAKTQNNLGSALQNLGEREAGADSLLAAVKAYENALLEYIREAAPLDWAATQGNLTNLELALFDKDGDGAHLDAAAAYLADAREVFGADGASQYLAISDRLAAQIKVRRRKLKVD
ncbi:MAG: hypothetical protein V3U96_12770 [Paracoccaceae bacterium]